MKINYDSLFEIMKEKGMNKSKLTDLAGISTNQMARMGKGESIQLETALKICNVLGCGLDVIKVEKSSL